jgi:two-component system, NarL family, nitrate/nitrite response regulator NarL
MQQTTSILIVDDHPLFRRGVRQLLEIEPRFRVMAEADSGARALELARAVNPDLVLLDLHMKGMGGLEVLRRLKDADFDGKVVVLTVSDAAEDLVAAIRAGADGYLLKDTDPDLLLERLRAAIYGQVVVSDNLSTVLARALREEAVASDRETAVLTEREQEILQCLAAGMSNKLIARDLDIAEGTVKVHVKHLLKKLRLRSRVEAAVWAVQRAGNRAD